MAHGRRRAWILTAAILGTTQFPALAEDPRLGWAASLGGPSGDAVQGVAADGGSIYAVGRFLGTADFDPGPGLFELTAKGSTDIFVVKLDGAGGLVWAQAFGGTAADRANDVAVDRRGDVWITGGFRETVDFDPGPGLFELTPLAGMDPFVLKLDADGGFLWAGAFADTHSDDADSLAVDAEHNVHVVGEITDPTDFDPGPGVFSLPPGLFIVTLDPDGSFVRAGVVEGTGLLADADVAVDRDGNAYMVGWFGSTADFDPGPGTLTLETGCFDTFVIKLDPTGQLVWARATQAEPCDGDEAWDTEAADVAVDDAGNVVTVGRFANEVDFDPGPGEVLLDTGDPGIQAAYAWMLDRTGQLAWIRHVASNDSAGAEAVALDGAGRIHVVGQFRHSADFDPGPGELLLDSGGQDGFVWTLDGAGDLVWVGTIHGTVFEDDASVLAVDVDACDNIVSAGLFSGTLDFDPDTDVVEMTSPSSSDEGFVWALAQTDRVEVDVAPDHLDWCGPVDGAGYDVVRGSLEALRIGEGDFSLATQACVADDQVSPLLPYAETPDGGDGLWLAIRPLATNGPGSYDSEGAAQAGGRDDGIAASGAGCP